MIYESYLWWGWRSRMFVLSHWSFALSPTSSSAPPFSTPSNLITNLKTLKFSKVPNYQSSPHLIIANHISYHINSIINKFIQVFFTQQLKKFDLKDENFNKFWPIKRKFGANFLKFGLFFDLTEKFDLKDQKFDKFWPNILTFRLHFLPKRHKIWHILTNSTYRSQIRNRPNNNND